MKYSQLWKNLKYTTTAHCFWDLDCNIPNSKHIYTIRALLLSHT